MITSTSNAKIKQVRALQARGKARREAGLFVVEGVRLAEEALEARWTPELALYSDALSARGQNMIAKLRDQNVQIEEVAGHVMEAASDTRSPQGILLTLPLRSLVMPDNLEFVLIADQVRDPGNLGTMLRGAAAAGAQAVFLTPGTADAFAPKVVRAGMGAQFRIAIQSLSWKEIEKQRKQHHLRLFLAAAGEGKEYTKADLTSPLALIVGGEAEGVGQEARDLADERIYIPMPGGGESLNAGMAASILLFEAARQRREET
ncbi:MAG: RNA methyltransferase [Chloroflexi bacterium]|nr:RNA methyltransferase [Chloroflexota bacterium]